MGCHKVPTSKNPWKIGGGGRAQLDSDSSGTAFDIPSNFWYLSYSKLQDIATSKGIGIETFR